MYGIRCFLCSRVALRHLSVGAHLAARCLSQCLGWQELAALKHHATCFQALLDCSLCLPTLPFRPWRGITFCNEQARRIVIRLTCKSWGGLCKKFSQSIEEKFQISNTSELCSECFDFGIKTFCKSICGTIDEIVEYFIVMFVYCSSNCTSFTNRLCFSGILLMIAIISSDLTPSTIATRVPFLPLASGLDIMV